MKPEADSPSASTTLQHIIRGLTHRWRLSRAMKGGGWGIVGGLIILSGVALISRFVPFWTSVEVRRTILWFLIGSGAWGTLIGALHPMPVEQRLRLFDRELFLADRLTTAWELEQGRINAPLLLVRMQLDETCLRVGEANIKSAFPVQFTRSNLVAAGILILLLIPALFLPNPQDTILARRKAEAQFVARAVEKIITSRDTLAQQTSLSLEEQATTLATLEQALDALNNRQTTFDEKQAALSLAEYRLAKLRTPEILNTAQQVAEASVLPDDTNLPDGSVIQQLEEALSNGNLDTASAILANLAQAESGRPLNPDEVQALAAMLESLVTALQEQQPEIASALDSAARAITEGTTASARDSLHHAADSLSGLAKAQSRDAAMQQAQAGVQQAQQSLRQASNPGTGQPGDPAASAAAGQSSGSDEPGGDPANGDNSDGENIGSAGTLNEAERERLAAVGGEITIPRSPGEGAPQPASGVLNEARIQYQEVYVEYAHAAEAKLSSRDYPPLLRDYIRDYFSNLEE